MMQRQPGCWPVGFRFDPSDEDLIDYYLKNKLHGNPSVVPDYLIKDLDIYQHNPEDLPHGNAAFPYRHYMRDNEMYFFTPRHPTSPGSTRVNRSAGGGLWDGHAKYVEITKNGKVIGHRRQLNFKIFVNGRNKKMIKTDWIMHEYRLKPDPDPASSNEEEGFDAMVLCRIYQKNENAAGREQSTSYGTGDFGKEEDKHGERLPKRQRIQEPGPSSQLYMPSAPAQPWEGGYEPLAYSAADYQEPSCSSFVPMMSGVADDYWSSSRAMASLDICDHASTSASTIPLLTFADYGAFAQLPPYIPIEKPLTATGAEYQVASAEYELLTEEPVSDIEVRMKWLEGSLTVEPDSSNDAGNLTEEPIDDDDAFAKSLEVDLTDETLTSHDAGNHATPSSSQNMSLPLEGAHEPLPLTLSDASNRDSSAASTVPMTVVPDDHHVSAQAQANVLPEEPSTSCDAENQVQMMGSVAGEVPDDDTFPLSRDCFPEFDLETLVSSMKAFDYSCFNIDEFL